ncbi:MAG: hypothetical protein QXH02_03175 [Desulfurococcaceae archaeon]
MFATLKYVLVIALVSVLVLFVAPLVLFIHDVLENPECIGLEIRPLGQVSEDTIKAVLEVNYCSEVPLKDLKIQLSDREIGIEEVKAGKVVKEVVLSRGDLEVGIVKVEFKIGGLYRVVLEYR